MSDLKPCGIQIEVNGVKRELLFTLNAIDDIQDKFGKSVPEVLDDIADEYPSGHTMRDMMLILLNDEVERKASANPECGLALLTEKEVGWLIHVGNYLKLMGIVFKAYGISVPELEEDDPNQTGGQMNN